MIGTSYSRRQASALVRRAAVAVVGGILATVGVVLLFIPGPGLLVLLLGLSILATEFGWAGRARQWVHREARGIARYLKDKRRPKRELRRRKGLRSPRL